MLLQCDMQSHVEQVMHSANADAEMHPHAVATSSRSMSASGALPRQFINPLSKLEVTPAWEMAFAIPTLSVHALEIVIAWHCICSRPDAP